MATIDDKVKLFTKIIYEKIDERNCKVFNDFKKEKELRLEELNRYIEEERAKGLAETLKKAEAKASELVTLERNKGQRQILTLKQELIEELVQQVKKRFENFTRDAEYKSYLFELLKGCAKGLSSGEYIISLTEEDIKKFNEDIIDIFKRHNISVSIKQSDIDFIGGFIVQHQGGKYRIDYSFLSKIDDSKELIGLKAYKY